MAKQPADNKLQYRKSPGVPHFSATCL